MKKIGQRMSYANVAATVALVLSIGGGGAAVAAGLAENSVGSPQIKNNSVLSKDVKNGTLGAKDIKPATVDGFGPGDAYFEQKTSHGITSGNEATHTVLSLSLPVGNYAVQASLGLRNTSGDTRDFTCRIQNPVGEFTNIIAESKARVLNNDYHAVALTGAVDIDNNANSPVTLTCTGTPGDWSAALSEPRLVAVEVGSLIEED